MNIRWINGNSINSIDIKNLELKFNIKFPNSYKDIVFKYDGSRPEVMNKDSLWKEAKFGEDKHSFMLLPIVDRNIGGSMEFYYEQSRKYSPKKIIPFAVDGGGNLFFFDYRESDSEPKIWFLYLDDVCFGELFDEDELEEMSLEERQQASLQFIANSFDEMLKEAK